MNGKKNDSGKLDYTLMPWNEVEEVMRVIQGGADKYSPNNWKEFKDPYRLLAALHRHAISYSKASERIKSGDSAGKEKKRDKESKLSHLAHVATNALFLMWYEHNRPDLMDK